MTVAMKSILQCLAQEPMRMEQLVLRTGESRAVLHDTVTALRNMHRIWCDDERFYHLSEMAVH